jgi:hypothetical protein
MEGMTQVEIAYRLRYIKDNQRNTIRWQGEEIAKMLSGLRSKLKRNTSGGFQL